jgi:hypothetical protein
MFTASDLAKHANIRLRTVQFWTAAGVILPDGEAHPGAGNHRQYPPHEAAIARALAPLGMMAVGVRTLRTIADMLRHVDGPIYVRPVFSPGTLAASLTPPESGAYIAIPSLSGEAS